MRIDPTRLGVTDGGPKTEIRISRARMGAATLGTVGFGLLCLWLTTRGGWKATVAWVCLAFIVVGVVIGLVATIHPRVVVTMNDLGVSVGKKLVPWSRIVDVPVNGNLGTKCAFLRQDQGRDVALPTAVAGGPDGIAEQVKAHPRYRGTR